ncbi:hypothetical protein [Raoultella ornithinolytica]|uniref:hypothetical protein n=1 Tax=Raoultella ornithinolytica TaxID=54291 RepID=UPI0013C32E63|nr:hypothetical protein [Raoultella ornithinolytica]HCI9483957.1 hypothetical protein [Raoultella ornithinolytica]
MNMLIKKILNVMLPGSQPDRCNDDEHTGNPPHITSMDFNTKDDSFLTSFKDEAEGTPALFYTRPYLDFEQWNNDNN